jgi:hypothetical protein
MIRIFGHEDFDVPYFSNESSALLARWLILEGQFPHRQDSAPLAEQHDRYFKVVQQDEKTFLLAYDDADPFFPEFDFERAVEKAATAKLLDYLELLTGDFDARIAERLGIEPSRDTGTETGKALLCHDALGQDPIIFDSRAEAAPAGDDTDKKKPRRARRSARAETVCPA